MSIKKSFTIPQGLANGIKSSIKSATNNHGQLHYDMMSIDILDTDPLNPRKLSITKDELFKNINKNDKEYEKKSAELEALNDLAESIKKVGIRNAIEVFKNGDKYRIISGERRYLASILAGQEYIPARINQKLDDLKLRYIQWVENINRQDLSLWERYNNLVTMADAYKKANGTGIGSESLREMLGVSDAQSYRYMALLNASSDIIELIKAGKVANLKVIQELVSIKSTAIRIKVLDEIQNSLDVKTSTIKLKKIKESSYLSKNSISLGKVKNSHTVKYIVNTILNDSKLIEYKEQFHNIDWESPKSINKAFKKLLTVIEKEINEKETVDEA